MLYFVGYLIEGEVARYYRQITSELSQNFNIENLALKLPAHLTFLPPFRAEDITSVKERLRSIASSQSASGLEIKGFGNFGSPARTIFLRFSKLDRPGNRFERLVNEIENAVQAPRRIIRPLHPHLSIARRLRPTDGYKIWEYLGAKPEPIFDLKFDNVTLFKQELGRWETCEHYTF